MMTLPIALARGLANHFRSEVVHAQRLEGGCIHQCRQIKLADQRSFFLKFQPTDTPDLLAAEVDGLESLSPLARVPSVLGHGESGGSRWLALEWLEILPHNPSSLDALGDMLGRLHAAVGTLHGHRRPGFLGTTQLENSPTSSWPEFFLSRRLEPMLRRLNDCGHPMPHARILRAAEIRLAGHEPPPSPLHGDLWVGNTGALPDGSPVIYDPSFHCGDAETDLAMLELFGGPLPESFLEQHAAHLPAIAGRRDRRPVYQMLHALNHLLIFGNDYEPMVLATLGKLDAPV